MKHEIRIVNINLYEFTNVKNEQKFSYHMMKISKSEVNYGFTSTSEKRNILIELCFKISGRRQSAYTCTY